MNKKSMLIPISLSTVKSFLIKGEKNILIDTGYPGDASRILKELSANSVSPHDVNMILITHSHHDHFGSALELRERTGAKIAVHRLEVEALGLGMNKDLSPYGIKGRFARIFSSEKPKTAGIVPDIIIEQDMSLEEFGVKGKVISTPGHTSGSVSVILDNGEAIVADLMMGQFIIRGAPAYPFYVYDISELRQSIKKVIALRPTKIYVSHGGPFDREDIIRRFQKDLSWDHGDL
jgi:glyoxylase-like metal-dependent hydrolase (beta-lactamase superfamily II)